MGEVEALGEAGARTWGEGPGEVGVWRGGEFDSSSEEEEPERDAGRRE